MNKIYVVTIDEEFEKSRVKGHTRTRKGRMERVREYETAGGRKVKVIGTPTKEEGYGRGFREIEETTPYGTKRRVVHRSMLKQKVNGGFDQSILSLFGKTPNSARASLKRQQTKARKMDEIESKYFPKEVK